MTPHSFVARRTVRIDVVTTTCLLFHAVCLAVYGDQAPSVRDKSAPAREIVLFPFDDQAIPFSRGLVLTLLPGRKSSTNADLTIDPKHPSKPVLAVGKKGDPDYPRAYFCGTVLKVDGEYRMWYSGFDGQGRRVCYAVSKDGVEWTKPKLGLVPYGDGGDKQNNLCAIDGDAEMRGMINLVLHDPEDPDPARRFKMVREVSSTNLLAAVSADGLRWTSVSGNVDILPTTNIEPSGFMKFDGAYYLCGHGGPIPHPIPSRGFLRPQKRMMVTLVSYDFETWTEVGHVSFRRDQVPPRPPLDFEYHRGEQVHLGASLWNRGNVVLGFYGQYHNPSNDRRDSSCDIGLVVSSDGVHYKEPIPDFKIIPGFEEVDRAEPRITQGQAFQNIGDRTIVYYGIWTENDRNSPTGVRIATWPRDRLGHFMPGEGVPNPACVSKPLDVRDGAKVYINATNLNEKGSLSVELLDEQFRPIAGYTAAEMKPHSADSGMRLPIAWREHATIEEVEGPIRVRVNWIGDDPERTRLYAVYVE